MIPYITAILCILFSRLAFGNNLLCGKQKVAYLFWSILPIFILLAFRADSVGMDTPNYIRSFENQKLPEHLQYEDDRIEIGYVFLEGLIAKTLSNPQWLFIITALFICLSIGHFIYQTAKEPMLALLFFITLGFFQFTLSGIRQSIALSITLWLYPFIKQKQFIRFIIGLFIASLFHKSAWLFLPAYFIAQQKITPIRILIELLGFLLLFLSAERLLLITADIMDYNYGIEETGNGYIFFIIVLLITICGIFNRTAIIQQNPTNKYVLNLNFISFSLWGLRLISRTAERVTLYYMPYSYLLLEEMIMSQKKSIKQFSLFIVILLAISLFFYRLSKDSSISPYTFYFE